MFYFRGALEDGYVLDFFHSCRYFLAAKDIMAFISEKYNAAKEYVCLYIIYYIIDSIYMCDLYCDNEYNVHLSIRFLFVHSHALLVVSKFSHCKIVVPVVLRTVGCCLILMYVWAVYVNGVSNILIIEG